MRSKFVVVKESGRLLAMVKLKIGGRSGRSCPVKGGRHTYLSNGGEDAVQWQCNGRQQRQEALDSGAI